MELLGDQEGCAGTNQRARVRVPEQPFQSSRQGSKAGQYFGIASPLGPPSSIVLEEGRRRPSARVPTTGMATIDRPLLPEEAPVTAALELPDAPEAAPVPAKKR